MKSLNIFFSTIIFTFALYCWAQPKIVKDIPVPDGYKRIEYQKGTYSDWLANLPLKSTNEIKRFDDGEIYHPFDIFGVVEMPLLFKSDLEQCADYCFRFWAEYHKQQNTLDKLYLFNYNGKKQFYDKSGKSFKDFLKQAMMYSNSHSLKKGCEVVDSADIAAGDMIVQNDTGRIGHAAVILQVCEPENEGQRLYLIGFSFIPAQEFHIERAESSYGVDGWFTLGGYCACYAYFGEPVLRRFK